MTDANAPFFTILHWDHDFIAIDKPEGYFVHPPEDARQRRFVRPEQVILSQLRRQVGRYLYPVHRLDVATSGVLVFALSSDSAQQFSQWHGADLIEKEYAVIARGWCEDKFTVDVPLALDSTGAMVPSHTDFQTLARFETPGIPNGKFPTSRYCWLKALPRTGRFHQIRRHLNRVSHPVIGDNDHGDSRHNRFFRETFHIQGLCLRAVRLKIQLGQEVRLNVEAPSNEKWQSLAKIAQQYAAAGVQVSEGRPPFS